MSEKTILGPRVLATLLLVLTALAGALGGVTLDRLLLRPDAAALAAERAPAEAPGEARAWRAAPRERYLTRMAGELELTSEQRHQLDSLLTNQQERMRAVTAEMQPRMRAIVQDTRSGMEEILTPEQRGRLRDLRPGDHRRPFPGGERRGMRGMPDRR